MGSEQLLVIDLEDFGEMEGGYVIESWEKCLQRLMEEMIHSANLF